jgi:hypothetical protein
VSGTATDQRGRRFARLWSGLDGFDLLVLALLGAVSLAFIGFLLFRGGVMGGWEGFVVADQGQYLDWIRQSGEHVLIGNSFDLEPDTRVYFQPLLLVSGLLHQLGLPLSAAWFMWKPVGVLVLFLGAWHYVRHNVEGVWARRAALVLALFFVSPLGVLSPLWGDAGRGTFDFISGEIWPAGQLWGYPLAAIAIGLMPLMLLGCERRLRRRPGSWAPGRDGALLVAGALIVSLLHPWQGATLTGVVVLAGLWHLRAGHIDARGLARALWPLVAGALVPALYFWCLSRLDASWQISEQNYRTPLEFEPTWRLALSLAPLALPALLAYRAPVRDFGERVLRLWVPVALVVYLAPGMPVRFHALNDVSIPLAVLAVRALAPYMRHLPEGRRSVAVVTAVAACLLITVPGAFDRLRSARGAVYLNLQPYLLEPGERDALDDLEDTPGEGGVLTTENIGSLVPKSTGRETWVGSPSWSPNFGERAGAASNLLSGRLAPDEAVDLVRSTGARFVLADCRGRADLRSVLRPVLAEARPYGCAVVYEIR